MSTVAFYTCLFSIQVSLWLLLDVSREVCTNVCQQQSKVTRQLKFSLVKQWGEVLDLFSRVWVKGGVLTGAHEMPLWLHPKIPFLPWMVTSQKLRK